VVHLKLWEGLTFEQIAGALDIPLNTAASRYRYGLDKLRGRLRPLYEELK
jgi:RNA polymerase sigma-70 factor (ECF subfamily)